MGIYFLSSSSTTTKPAAILNGTQCNIHVVDIEDALTFHLPARYTPAGWEHNQYAVELWLRRAIENHPWRVHDPAQADVIFAAANFSKWCVAGKTFSRRRLWEAAFHPKAGKARIFPENMSTPIFVATQYEGARIAVRLQCDLGSMLLVASRESTSGSGLTKSVQ